MKSYEDLEQEIEQLKKQLKINREHNEFKSSLAHIYHFSGNQLIKLDRNNYMGSGVIVEIRALSGQVLVNPFTLKDGLSDSSINSLLDDMEYSFNIATEFKPISKRK